MEFTTDLPAAGSSRAPRYQAEANECRAMPSTWGLLTTFTVPSDAAAADMKRIGSHARMVAHHVRTGRYVAFRPAGSYESSSRTATDELTGNRSIAVYVRYVGGDES